VDPTPVTVTFPAPRHVYDLRAHQYLGYLTRVQGSPSAASPFVLAVLNSPIGPLSVTRQLGEGMAMQVKPGDTVHFSIRLSSEGGGPALDCPVDVQVRNPAGKVVDYYGADMMLRKGTGEFTLPLAINDSPGVWQVSVSEPFTGREAKSAFAVRR
jgi:hypothetical protein